MYNNFYEYKIDRFGYDHTWLDDREMAEFIAKAINFCGEADSYRDAFIERWALDKEPIRSHKMVSMKNAIQMIHGEAGMSNQLIAYLNSLGLAGRVYLAASKEDGKGNYLIPSARTYFKVLKKVLRKAKELGINIDTDIELAPADWRRRK